MRGTELRSLALAAGALLMVSPAAATAQLRSSENFALIQIVDGDTVAITGSRPSLRGRVMYGTQVAWGKSWTPGANMATVLRVDRDFRIDGTPVPAGKYSVWLVPRADDQWSMMLDPRHDLFHTAHPDSTAEQLHFRLVAKTIEPVETLTWSINQIRGWRSRVQMAWADKAVEFELRLSAGEINLQVAEEVARPLLGTYEVPQEFRQGPFQFERIVISWAEGILSWRVEGGNAPDWYDGTTWVLAPRGAETFVWFMAYEGEVVGQAEGMVLEFPEGGPRAAAIEFRGVPGDQLYLRAVRQP